jgi:predicted phosphodiesterase
MSESTKKFDPNATPEMLVDDLRKVQAANPDKFISRNFYRVHGSFSEKTWDCVFGTFQEFKSQAGLELTRHQKQLERHIAKHASLDVYRDFQVTQIAPWVGKYEKPQDKGRTRTMLIASDFHDKEVDPFVLNVFLDTAKRIQPDIIVLNGDILDLYEFSRFDKDPRQIDLKGRFDFVRECIFQPLREACPKAQIDLTLGNHEQRLIKHLASATPFMRILADLHKITLSKLFGLDEFEINLVTKWDISAFTPGEVREQAKKNYIVYYDCFVCNHVGNEGFGKSGTSGHTHRPDVKTSVSVNGPLVWTTTGGMCRTNAEYTTTMEKWHNSFLIVHVDTVTKQVVPEHILFSDYFTCVGGKYYYR